MKRNQIGIWLSGGVLGLALAGCESGSLPLGGVYDLSEYLFPKQAGTVVYQMFTSEKPKDESSFTDETYQDDMQYGVDRNGASVAITDKANTGDVTRYAIATERIAVEETAENLSYHLDRSVNAATNFVQEATLRETQEAAGSSRLTYECNATEHVATMKIDPNPKTYKDILKILCVRRNTVYATVGGKQFQTIVETKEEKYAAKDVGIIQSEQTTCEYTKVDTNAQADDGCTRKTYKIWTFVAE